MDGARLPDRPVLSRRSRPGTCPITSAARSRTAARLRAERHRARRRTRRWRWRGRGGAPARYSRRRRRARLHRARSEGSGRVLRGRQQRIVPDPVQPPHRRDARGGPYPAHVLGRAVQRARRSAGSGPIRSSSRRVDPDRSLHIARSMSGRRPTAARRWTGSAATSRVTIRRRWASRAARSRTT